MRYYGIIYGQITEDIWQVRGKNMRTKAYVNGRHGLHNRIFLIKGGRVVRERDVDMYLKYGWKEVTPLGHFNGKFHFR